MQQHLRTISGLVGKPEQAVAALIRLLDEGASVPFISRYRKEHTQGMDEEQIRTVRDHIQILRETDKRREAMLASLTERELLTDELERSLQAAASRQELEDIYLPYRVKRKTRADAAREKGLGPLARFIVQATGADLDLPQTDEAPIDLHACNDEELAGARDIIAEHISEHISVRTGLRELFEQRAVLASKPARGVDRESAEARIYADYFDHREPARKAPSHRILAMFRGEREGILSTHALPDSDDAHASIRRQLFPTGKPRRTPDATTIVAAEHMDAALEDAWKRLLAPALENELTTALKKRAEESAAEVFAQNLRSVLLEPPLGGVPMIALDPGLRTGCKLVVLDEHGSLLHHEAIYPLPPRNDTGSSAERIRSLVSKHGCRVVAIGNGTGGREAQDFVAGLDLKTTTGTGVAVISVNEAGASVYSASRTAREEFPDQDVTVRGAVSIGRRLMDPLAELVKIDPKSIGVGQYQHDVDPAMLSAKLDDTVVSCVNAVGADLNTASEHVLRYVAGLNNRSARAIVKQRSETGGYTRRQDLLKVSGIGAKTFEQAAGFLRVAGPNPLDRTAIHPERYPLVEQMARDINLTVEDLVGNADAVAKIEASRYVNSATMAETVRDILDSLKAPGRDPRPAFELLEFRDDVRELTDLKPGMKLNGVVRNVTDFGAFVDVGVHRDGLVHISHMSKDYVAHPSDVVQTGMHVEVTVLEVDSARKRISLGMV
ncbi:MAG: RNA-binding transcriptional accessory protein [Spirochaetaceae bacterium]|nr:MAG: RNA-binding transcriptional accessory protein [Spirochaetaceae bacterium]